MLHIRGMGEKPELWLNHFFLYGSSPKKENPLTLGFSQLDGGDERRKCVLLLPISIPTRPIPEECLDSLKQELNELGLGDCPLREKSRSSPGGHHYVTLEIMLPNERSLLHRLPKAFQTGDYGKRFRFDFFPEQVFPSPEYAEEVLKGGHESHEPEFMSEGEFRGLPYVVLDIEKPLWKKEHEKNWIERREKVLKALKKEGDESRQERMRRVVSGLERRLTLNIEGVGEAKLFTPTLSADVSFVTAVWGDGKGGEEKEIYLLDPGNECSQSNFEAFKVRTFANEKELVVALTREFHSRKPVVSFGHNQVYDYTQLRFAAESHKDAFDPGVEGQQPRRDFVKTFLQRLREDLIYIDTMWLAQLFFPYLRQRSLGTSLRLEPVANHLGIPFSKSLTHEELREVEARRLLGKTPEIRKEALEKLIQYSSGDIDVTHEIAKRIPYAPLLTWMKRVLPFSTYSKLAFSGNSAREVHDFRYYQKHGCLPYFGFATKERLDEQQFFTPFLERTKRNALSSHGVKKARNGEYSDVSEWYLPLESWLFLYAVGIAGRDLASAHATLTKDPKTRLAFFQYVKSMLKDPLIDLLLTRRYESQAREAKDFLSPKGLLPFEGRALTEPAFRESELDELCKHYRAMERAWFSLTPELGREKKSLLDTLDTTYCPGLALYVRMQEHKKELRDGMSSSQKADLSRALNGLERFFHASDSVGEGVNQAFLATQKALVERSKRRFFARYGFDSADFGKKFDEYYAALTQDLKDNGAEFLEAKGDYIFLRGVTGKDLKFAIKVRELDTYRVGKNNP